ncbi:CHASE domain-containing protein [Celerinatantimonas yamalensis]|uniref:histidine kinase n=1 Tax=Celerinatantimonas yamalensis TaxID=559956 RepID=A0ABW9GCF1_9GAMM
MWFPLLAGLLMTAAVAWILNYQNEYELNVYTNTLANNAESLIEERFQHVEHALKGTRGAIVTVGVDKITRQQFEDYINSRDIPHEFPGVMGFGFIRRVPVAQEARFLAQARTDGAPNFTIRTLTPHHGDRFIIQYIYPLKRNRQAMGFDIASEKNRRTVAILAARNDKAYITAPISLVQDHNQSHRGALVLLPIYPKGVQLNTSEAREKAVLGWSYAPVIIDDVLANIGSITKQALLSLSNLTESQPFYRSSNTDASDLVTEKVIRDIFVLGQHWKMIIIPTVDAVKRVKSWDIGWVIVLGLTLTLGSLLAINALQPNPLTDAQNDDVYPIGFQSILTFFQSSQFNRTWPYGSLIILLILLVSSWFIVKNNFKNVSNDLLKAEEKTLSSLNREAIKYRRDVLFLTNSSPITALMHQHAANHAQRRLSSQKWDKRLADIFRAYMLSNPDVYQVRLIEANHGWQEAVKVQRMGESLEVLPKELLQPKGNEPYIAKTLQVKTGKVYVSDMNLNREFGKVANPDQPVWRFSTPLFHANGSPFGIIIINVSADRLLTTLSDNIPQENTLYVTNSNGDFLLHPNPLKTFTFEHGHSYRWKDEFTPAALWPNLSLFNLNHFQSQQGDVLVKQGHFLLREHSPKSALQIYSVRSLFSVIKKIGLQIGMVILLLLMLVVVSITIQYWAWLTAIKRQREIWHSQLEAQRTKDMVRFKVLLETSPDATLITDEAGTIQIVNKQAEHMFGYDRSDLEGQPIHKLLPGRFRQAHKDHVKAYMQQPQSRLLGSNKELFGLNVDGNQFPVEINLNAVRLDEQLLVYASVRDISTRLAMENQLRSALREAEQATESKSVFLANTSHEIRTPLNAVIGLTYLLDKEPLTEGQHQLVDKIQISGKSLLGIINDVLDLSKIEANEMALEEKPVELKELIEEVAGIFDIQAEAKNLEFHLNIDPNLPSWVISDSVRLRQILVNLLSNALKFTHSGEISIGAELQPHEQPLSDNHIGIRFKVKDTGIGIPIKSQKQLFQPFMQADTSTTRRFGGTGLGLSIVRKLVDLMGGSLGMESAEGAGSTFWVNLPLKVPTLDDIAEQENQNLTLFVLIAEDNPADASRMQKMTRALGWRSQIVNNGAELVQTVTHRKENNLRPPDALLVDWQMPIMDGLDALNLLASQIGREHLPAVLMISAYERETIVPLDSECYVSKFLNKPVDSSALFNAVNDVVTEHTGNSKRVLQSTNTETILAKWLPNMNLLVVDDSSINLEVVCSILERNGAITDAATSGQEALERLKEGAADYDAVLMDVQMPGMDGLETTRLIRHSLGLTELPIIALTAGALLEEKKRALDSGMNYFLTKPINASQLINVLRTSYEAYRGKEIPLEAIDPADADNAVDTANDNWPTITGLNNTQAKNLLLGDKELFLRTLEGLLQEHANLAELPTSNIDAPESEALRLSLAAQVHKLRSNAGMVGAKNMQQLASQTEQALRTPNTPTKELLSQLALSLNELEQASQEVLATWQQEKHVATTVGQNTTPLKAETLQQILKLLTEQDLNAPEEVEKHSAEFREALGDDDFNQLQDCLMKLNYQQAITLLEPLKKTIGER